MGQHTHIGTALEFGPLFDAEFVAQVGVLLLHIEGLFALQALDISRFGEDVHRSVGVVDTIFGNERKVIIAPHKLGDSEDVFLAVGADAL